jgi:hypothetical protein
MPKGSGPDAKKKAIDDAMNWLRNNDPDWHVLTNPLLAILANSRRFPCSLRQAKDGKRRGKDDQKLTKALEKPLPSDLTPAKFQLERRMPVNQNQP